MSRNSAVNRIHSRPCVNTRGIVVLRHVQLTSTVCSGDDEGGTAHSGGFTCPGGARPPGFPSAGRPPAGQAGQQQPRGSKPSKQWVLDGRVYNYK